MPGGLERIAVSLRRLLMLLFGGVSSRTSSLEAILRFLADIFEIEHETISRYLLFVSKYSSRERVRKYMVYHLSHLYGTMMELRYDGAMMEL